MAFPTQAISEDFDGADTSPCPGFSWNTLGTTISPGRRLSNQLAPQADGDAYIGIQDGGPHAADMEAQALISTVPSNAQTVGVLVRVQNFGGGVLATDGYLLAVTKASGTDSLFIQRLDNGTATTLGSTISQEVSNGHSIGIEIVDDDITGYYHNGTSWSSVGTRTDATYSGTGEIGIFSGGGTTLRVNGFGGGDIITSSPQNVNVNLSVAGGIGNNLSNLFLQSIDNSVSGAIGFDINTNYIQNINTSIASGTGLELSFSPGVVSEDVDNAISSAIGYDIISSYIVTLNSSVASAIGNDLDFSVGGINANVDNSSASAVGFDLTSVYIQIVNNSIASSVGYDLATTSEQNAIVDFSLASGQGFNLDNIHLQNVDFTNAEAIGLNPNTIYLQEINAGLATAIGLEVFAGSGLVINVNFSDAIAIGNALDYIVGGINGTVNNAVSSAVGNNLQSNYLQVINLSDAIATGLELIAQLSGQNITVNISNANALGYLVNYNVGSVIIAVDKSNAFAIGYQVSPTEFVLIASPDRTFIPLRTNRVFNINEIDRVFVLVNKSRTYNF